MKRRNENISLPLKKRRVFDQCNYCLNDRELVFGKKYCKKCGMNGVECSQCHMPKNHKHYTESGKIFDTCFKKSKRHSIGGMVTYQSFIPDENNQIDILNFFIESKGSIQRIIEEQMFQHRGVKYFLTSKVGFIKFDKDGERVRSKPIFHSKISIIVNTE